MKNKHLYEAPRVKTTVLAINDIIVMSLQSNNLETEGFGDNPWE